MLVKIALVTANGPLLEKAGEDGEEEEPTPSVEQPPEPQRVENPNYHHLL